MDTLEQLHELHARLLRAQRAETAAIRKLSEFTASGIRGRDGFRLLLDIVQAARRTTVETYEEWDRYVRTLHDGSADQPAAPGETAPADSQTRSGSPGRRRQRFDSAAGEIDR